MTRSEILYVIVTCLVLIFGIDRYFRLSPNEAKHMALELANNESFSRFKINFFEDGDTPKFEHGRWILSRGARLKGVDVSVSVSFNAYGWQPDTRVTMYSPEVAPDVFFNFDQGGGPESP
jgi:hypothetical protein